MKKFFFLWMHFTEAFLFLQNDFGEDNVMQESSGNLEIMGFVESVEGKEESEELGLLCGSVVQFGVPLFGEEKRAYIVEPAGLAPSVQEEEAGVWV